MAKPVARQNPNVRTFHFTNKRTSQIATVQAFTLESAWAFCLNATGWKERDMRILLPEVQR